MDRTRRWFLERLAGVGAGAALGPLLAACGDEPEAAGGALDPTRSAAGARGTAGGSPTTALPTAVEAATATATATRARGAGTVALVRTTDRAAGVRQAIELLGLEPFQRTTVLLKPNLNSDDEAPGSTHRDVTVALVQALSDMGARSITVGDRSGMGDTREVMRQTGVFELGREMGFDAVAFDDLPDEEWVSISDEDHHWSRGFAVPRIVRDAERIVQTCNLKTHRYGGHFSLSLKNSVGMAAKLLGGHDYMTELHDSPHQRRMIAEINTAYEPALVVVDGVKAFVRGGPDTGDVADGGVVLAGVDRVAIDAVGVAILRMLGTTADVAAGRVFEQEQIARAVELGLGVTSPQAIDFAVADADSRAYAERVREVLIA